MKFTMVLFNNKKEFAIVRTKMKLNNT